MARQGSFPRGFRAESRSPFLGWSGLYIIAPRLTTQFFRASLILERPPTTRIRWQASPEQRIVPQLSFVDGSQEEVMRRGAPHQPVSRQKLAGQASFAMIPSMGLHSSACPACSHPCLSPVEARTIVPEKTTPASRCFCSSSRSTWNVVEQHW